MNKEQAQREKILERVRALLAMTVENGCTEAEAMVAAAKAALLMEEYDITFADAQSVRNEEIGEQIDRYPDPRNPEQLHPGAHWVMIAIAEFFDCKTWFDVVNVRFFGMKADAELAHRMLAMVVVAMDCELAPWLTVHAGTSIDRDLLASSFMQGMAHRIGERLRFMKEARSEKARKRGTDLVVVKGQLVEAKFADFLRAHGINLSSGKTAPIDGASFLAGWAAADRVDLGQTKVASEETVASEAGARKRPPDWLIQRLGALRTRGFDELTKAKDLASARRSFADALSIARALVNAAPDDDDLREKLCLALTDCGFAADRGSDHRAALEFYIEAEAMAKALIAKEDGDSWREDLLMRSLIGRANSIAVLRGNRRGIKAQKAAAWMARKLASAPAADAEARRRRAGFLADASFYLAQSLDKGRRLHRARAAYRESIAQAPMLPKEKDGSERWSVESARHHVARLTPMLERRAAALTWTLGLFATAVLACLAFLARLPSWLPSTLQFARFWGVALAICALGTAFAVVEWWSDGARRKPDFARLLTLLFSFASAACRGLLLCLTMTAIAAGLYLTFFRNAAYAGYAVMLYEAVPALSHFIAKESVAPLALGCPAALAMGMMYGLREQRASNRQVEQWRKHLEAAAGYGWSYRSMAMRELEMAAEYERCWNRRFDPKIIGWTLLAGIWISSVFAAPGHCGSDQKCQFEVYGLIFREGAPVAACASLLGYLSGGLWPWRARAPVGEVGRVRRLLAD